MGRTGVVSMGVLGRLLTGTETQPAVPAEVVHWGLKYPAQFFPALRPETRCRRHSSCRPSLALGYLDGVGRAVGVVVDGVEGEGTAACRRAIVHHPALLSLRSLHLQWAQIWILGWGLVETSVGRTASM